MIEQQRISKIDDFQTFDGFGIKIKFCFPQSALKTLRTSKNAFENIVFAKQSLWLSFFRIFRDFPRYKFNNEI